MKDIVNKSNQQSLLNRIYKEKNVLISLEKLEEICKITSFYTIGSHQVNYKVNFNNIQFSVDDTDNSIELPLSIMKISSHSVASVLLTILESMGYDVIYSI